MNTFKPGDTVASAFPGAPLDPYFPDELIGVVERVDGDDVLVVLPNRTRCWYDCSELVHVA